MKQKRKMINVGKENFSIILNEIGLSKGEIGEYIGLTKGGFWNITHVSGKMNLTNWTLLKKLYFEKTGRKLEIEEQVDGINFDQIEDIELVRELENRGWEVTCVLRK